MAGEPGAPRPSLCLAEFFRNNGFDGYEEDMAPTDGSLGSSRTQFPFTPYDRQSAYLAVLGNAAASADDKALALNRLVRCYAPSGYSSCGAKQVEQPQRKAWFDRLKRDYPASIDVILPKLRRGGVLIIDNLLWSGRILDAADQSPDTEGVRAVTRRIMESGDWIASIVPVRDGVLVAYRA